jgi:hypothetical protein
MKTDQMGIPEQFAYIFVYNYAIIIYIIVIKSYGSGLLNKTICITLASLNLKI